MRANNNERLLILIAGLLGGAALLVMTWHFGASGLIPAEHRYSIGDIAWAVWGAGASDSDELKQMIALGYPWAFLATVVPSVAFIGLLIATWAWTLRALP